MHELFYLITSITNESFRDLMRISDSTIPGFLKI
jgi:hypothetical protein